MSSSTLSQAATAKPLVVLVSGDNSLNASLQKMIHGENVDFVLIRDFDMAVQVADARNPTLLLVDRQGSNWKLFREHPLFRNSLIMAIQSPQISELGDACANDLDEGLDACCCEQSYRQIVAYIRSLLRRQSSSPHIHTLLKVGDIRMDLSGHEVRVRGHVIELTRREFTILQQFMAFPGRVLSRQDLLDSVWGKDYALGEHVLDVHISSLRQKIETQPSSPGRILTVRTIGFKMIA